MQVDAALALTLLNYVTAGGTLIVAADEITTAAASYWPPNFLGLDLGPVVPFNAASVTDLQARPRVKRVCPRR